MLLPDGLSSKIEIEIFILCFVNIIRQVVSSVLAHKNRCALIIFNINKVSNIVGYAINNICQFVCVS